MKLGVIADTHGVLLPGVQEKFQGVDKIIHAGDVGSRRVIQDLEKIAPVTAVGGNHEPERIEGLLPDPSTIILEGHNVVVTHRFVSVEWNIFREFMGMLARMYTPRPRLIIFGHMHCAINEEIQGIYFFNPGYAGPDPYEPDPTVGLIEIKRDMIKGEILKL